MARTTPRLESATVADRRGDDNGIADEDLLPTYRVTPEAARRVFDEAVRTGMVIGSEESIAHREADEDWGVVDAHGHPHIGDLISIAGSDPARRGTDGASATNDLETNRAQEVRWDTRRGSQERSG